MVGTEERPAEPVPMAVGQHRRSEELARLEAALFLAREPLTTRRLAKLARLDDGTRARSLIKELRLLQDASGSAFRVEQIAGGFQILTRAPFGPWVRRLQDAAPGGRLSPAALETLAIVAYRQPTTRAEIEAIRGVGSEEMLRQLVRDLRENGVTVGFTGLKWKVMDVLNRTGLSDLVGPEFFFRTTHAGYRAMKKESEALDQGLGI